MDMLWYGYSELVWFAQWTVISTIIMDLYLVGGDWNHGFWWLSHHIGNSNPNWRTHIFQRVWNHQRLVFVSIFFKRTKKKGYHVFSICLLDITFNDTDLVPPRWQCLVLQWANSLERQRWLWVSPCLQTICLPDFIAYILPCGYRNVVYIYIYVCIFIFYNIIYIYLHTISEMKKTRVIYQKSRVWSII